MSKATEYEILTKEIYEALLASENSLTIDVQHNVKIPGKSNSHQIDVYWEFVTAGVKHKVAIECKHHDKPIGIGKVRDFFGVLSDIGNISGIMVSQKGFQSGAIDYAKYREINLKILQRVADFQGIKKISFQGFLLTTQISDMKPEFDVEWFKSNISHTITEETTYQISGMADQIWLVDEIGNRIKNIHQLQNELPHPNKTVQDLEHKFEFDSAFMEIETFGKVKMSSISFRYNSLSTPVEPVVVQAHDFVKAILTDVYTNEMLYVNNDGKVNPK